MTRLLRTVIVVAVVLIILLGLLITFRSNYLVKSPELSPNASARVSSGAADLFSPIGKDDLSSSSSSSTSNLFSWMFDSGYEEKDDEQSSMADDEMAEDLDLFIERHRRVNLLPEFVSSLLKSIDFAETSDDGSSNNSTKSSTTVAPSRLMSRNRGELLQLVSNLSLTSPAVCEPNSQFSNIEQQCLRICDAFSGEPLNVTKDCSQRLAQCLASAAVRPCDASPKRVLNTLLADAAKQFLLMHNQKRNNKLKGVAAAPPAEEEGNTESSTTKHQHERCAEWLREQCITRHIFTAKQQGRYHGRAGVCMIVSTAPTVSVDVVMQTLTPDLADSPAPQLVKDAFSHKRVKEAVLSALSLLKSQLPAVALPPSTLLLVDLERYPCEQPPASWNCPECTSAAAGRSNRTVLRFTRRFADVSPSGSGSNSKSANGSAASADSGGDDVGSVLLPPLFLLYPGGKKSSNLRTRALYSSLRSAVDRRGVCGHVAWHHRAPLAGVFCGTDLEPLPALANSIRQQLGFIYPPTSVLIEDANRLTTAPSLALNVSNDALEVVRRRHGGGGEEEEEDVFASSTSTDFRRFFARGTAGQQQQQGWGFVNTARGHSEQNFMLPILAFGKSRSGRSRSYIDHERLAHRSQLAAASSGSTVSLAQRVAARLAVPSDWCDPQQLCSDSEQQRAEPWSGLSGFSLAKTKLAVLQHDMWLFSEGADAVPVAAGGAAPVLVLSHVWKERRPERGALLLRMRGVLDLLGAPWRTYIPWLISDYPPDAQDDLSPAEELAERKRLREEASQAMLPGSRRKMLQAQKQNKEKETRAKQKRHSASTFQREVVAAGESFEKILGSGRNSVYDKALQTVATNHRDIVRALRKGSSVQEAYLAGIVLLSLIAQEL